MNDLSPFFAWEQTSIAVSRDQNVSLSEALNDGEDFELLFTLAPRNAEALMDWQERKKSFYFYPIGTITKDAQEKIDSKSFTHFK